MSADYYDDSAPAPAVDEAVLGAGDGAFADSTGEIDLVMVGLPVRGKSFISSKLQSFLQWSAHATNAKKRRQDSSPDCSRRQTSSGFSDPSDAGAKAQREAIAMETLEALLQWFEQEAATSASSTPPTRRATAARRWWRARRRSRDGRVGGGRLHRERLRRGRAARGEHAREGARLARLQGLSEADAPPT